MPPSMPVRDQPDAAFRRMRLERRSVPGQTYLLSVATLYRRPVFSDDEAARAVCRVHTAQWPWRDSAVLAWVLMPDHWHGMIELGALDSLPTLVQRLKSNSARIVRLRHPDTGQVWEKGFHDRALRDASGVLATARYVVANPLRAGLACRVGEYAWWDAVWLNSSVTSKA